jgi:CheY-like chemotaxis protein
MTQSLNDSIDMTLVTCPKNQRDPTMLAGMTLSSLLVCKDKAPAQVLSGVLEELNIRTELCEDAARAFLRLAQDHFDIIIIDCETQADVLPLLNESHYARLNDSTLTVAVVTGQESIREMFSLGVNFVLYKPVSYERAVSTLRAAQSVLQRDKRRKTRASVHAHATIDYAGVEQARATLIDLAEDGMAVNFGKKVPPYTFNFNCPGRLPVCGCPGRWCGRIGMGALASSLSMCPRLRAACCAPGWREPSSICQSQRRNQSKCSPRSLPATKPSWPSRKERSTKSADATPPPERACAPSRAIAAAKPAMLAAWAPKSTSAEVR